ncbi:UDP-N-acetylglucosamine transferase subunit ALG13-like [Acridotheres tristis]
MKSVFVTVGTTSFDELIATARSPPALQGRAVWEGEGEAVPGPGWSGAGHTPHTPSLCPLIPFITPPPCPFPTALIPSVHPSPGPQALQSRGYQKLVLQVGRGSLPQPQPSSSSAVAVEVFRFKDSLAAELQSADLVISHAGAGSCLETLEKGKPLIVVINDKLMDNHQLELAKQLHRDGYVLYCNCSTLVETLQSMDLSALKPFPPGQPEKFASFLDKVFGIQ